MNFITIKFEPTETIQERTEKIVEEMYPLMPMTVQEACLEKRGHLDRIYGIDDQDLLWAEGMRITYDRVKNPVCRECGCTEKRPCHHDEQGACWWVANDLCSHCFMQERGMLKGPVHRPWRITQRAESGSYRYLNHPLKK